MWYVRDEFSNKIYFKSEDVRKTQNFASRYNKTFKFAGQRYFRFNISDFAGLLLFPEDKIDISIHTKHFGFFSKCQYSHPFAIKSFNDRHVRYIELKLKKVIQLAKKYHLWSYTVNGRKCDGFDF